MQLKIVEPWRPPDIHSWIWC